jgi:RNA polymerase sigma factor (sigma-70 family)
MMTLPRVRPTLADRELVARVAEGHLEALGELFDRYETDVRRFLGRLGVTASDADDLVQATFLELLRAAVKFDPALSAKGFLFGLATILVRRHRRSLSRRAALLFAFRSEARQVAVPSVDGSFETDEELRRFQRALERLSSKKREVFALVVLEGVSGEEVARTLGIPLNTVWTRLHHARRELRRALEEGVQ